VRTRLETGRLGASQPRRNPDCGSRRRPRPRLRAAVWPSRRLAMVPHRGANGLAVDLLCPWGQLPKKERAYRFEKERWRRGEADSHPFIAALSAPLLPTHGLPASASDRVELMHGHGRPGTGPGHALAIRTGPGLAPRVGLVPATPVLCLERDGLGAWSLLRNSGDPRAGRVLAASPSWPRTTARAESGQRTAAARAVGRAPRAVRHRRALDRRRRGRIGTRHQGPKPNVFMSAPSSGCRPSG
jgi:hypothetical protein